MQYRGEMQTEVTVPHTPAGRAELKRPAFQVFGEGWNTRSVHTLRADAGNFEQRFGSFLRINLTSIISPAILLRGIYTQEK